MHKVLVPFGFYPNGITRVDLAIGDVREDFGDSAAGLIAEGYIAPVDGKVSAPVAPIEPDAAAIDETIETTAELAAPENAAIKRGRRR